MNIVCLNVDYKKGIIYKIAKLKTDIEDKKEHIKDVVKSNIKENR